MKIKRFIIYNKNGVILRTGSAPANMFSIQRHGDELIMEGTANDVTQKIVGGQVVDKTPEELEAKPLKIPEKDMPATITKEQWQDVLKRLATLEKK